MVSVFTWRWLALCCALLTTSAALAQDKAAARAAFRRGTQHYNLNEIPQALAAFKEAYRAYEDPGLLFNIGQCQRRLGQNEEAVLSFRAYLREVRDAPNRDEVAQLVARLSEQIEADRQMKARAEAEARAQKAERDKAEAEAQQKAAAAAAAAAASNTVVAAPPPKPPLYKRWWLWTTVGAVVVVGIGLGVGLGLGLPPSDRYPKLTGQTNGTYKF